MVLFILHQRCICYQYLQKFQFLTHVSQKSNTTCCHGVWAFRNTLMVFISIITTLQLKELLYPWVLRHLLQKKLSMSEPEGKPPGRCYQMYFLCCLCFSSIAEPSVLLKYWFALTWILINSLSRKDLCYISLKIWTLVLLEELPVEDQCLLCRMVEGRLGQLPLCWVAGLAVWVLVLVHELMAKNR